MNLIEEVKHCWDKLDKSDHRQLKEFFESYPLLTIADFGMLAGVSYDTIKQYWKRSGLSKPTGKSSRQTFFELPPELETDVDPYEDTKEWWEKHYAKFGYRKLAKLAGLRKPERVPIKLKKHNIPRRGQLAHKKHPCNNHEWLYHYHITASMGVYRMGKLAGVHHSTISRWLDNHKIARRHFDRSFVAKDPRQQDSEKGRHSSGGAVPPSQEEDID